MEPQQPQKEVKYFSHDFEYSQHRAQQEQELNQMLQNQTIKQTEEDHESLMQQSQLSWDKFYKHNQDKFFKNRNYLSFAFDIIESKIASSQQISLLEVGCGTGNTIIPMKEKYGDQITFYACDFSPNAVALLQKLEICQKAFVKDLVKEEINEVEPGSLDFITMIFFLSAVHPADHAKVVQKLAKLLKKGGYMMFRDYGAYDLAMMRFVNKQKGVVDIDSMLFKRGDNTMACFFTEEQLTDLMKESGMEKISSEYCTVESKNVKRELVMRRVFINGKYRKL